MTLRVYHYRDSSVVWFTNGKLSSNVERTLFARQYLRVGVGRG